MQTWIIRSLIAATCLLVTATGRTSQVWGFGISPSDARLVLLAGVVLAGMALLLPAVGAFGVIALQIYALAATEPAVAIWLGLGLTAAFFVARFAIPSPAKAEVALILLAGWYLAPFGFGLFPVATVALLALRPAAREKVGALITMVILLALEEAAVIVRLGSTAHPLSPVTQLAALAASRATGVTSVGSAIGSIFVSRPTLLALAVWVLATYVTVVVWHRLPLQDVPVTSTVNSPRPDALGTFAVLGTTGFLLLAGGLLLHSVADGPALSIRSLCVLAPGCVAGAHFMYLERFA